MDIDNSLILVDVHHGAAGFTEGYVLPRERLVDVALMANRSTSQYTLDNAAVDLASTINQCRRCQLTQKARPSCDEHQLCPMLGVNVALFLGILSVRLQIIVNAGTGVVSAKYLDNATGAEIGPLPVFGTIFVRVSSPVVVVRSVSPPPTVHELDTTTTSASSSTPSPDRRSARRRRKMPPYGRRRPRLASAVVVV